MREHLRSQPDLRTVGGGRRRITPGSGLLPVYTTLPAKGYPGEIATTWGGAGVLYYKWDGSAWALFGAGGGATTFLALTDTPAAYAGAALYVVRVNAAANALEFYDHEGAANPHAIYLTQAEADALYALLLHGLTHTNGTDDIQDAAADGATKGIASFKSIDFDSTAGNIELQDNVTKASTTDSGQAIAVGHDLKIVGGAGISTAGAGNTVTVTANGKSVHQYAFAPDAAPGDSITADATNPQGLLHHSGPDGDTALKMWVDAETAPGTNAVIKVKYGDTDTLDTVSSWTEIATLTLTDKGINTTIMTDVAIPADRLVALFVDSISGAGAKDVSVTLRVKRAFTT